MWGGVEYRFKKRMTRQLRRLVGHRSITYTEGECQDLPARVPIRKVVVLPDDMQTYYKAELTKLRSLKGKPGTLRETRASFLRMRQLASGFIGLHNDETGERIEIEFPDNPKLDMLMELLREIPTEAKVLVFHEYIWTGNRIAKELRLAKIKHERLHGGQKDVAGALRRFREDPECKVFVINNLSGSVGLNLQQAAYVIFFETSVRPEIRQQAERRARRSGQQSDRVFIIDIVAKEPDGHSIDERVLTWLEQGKDLLTAVLKGAEEV
jgi:SNF2 family DNA or RNA helicase